ncbi:hypothetical protein [Bifidobacterium aquikefiri]
MTRESQQRRAIQMLRDGATDERIRAEFGYNQFLIDSLRRIAEEKGPKF